ncbi:kinase-like domain-containing protein [Rhizophagus irregularis DAOM 181602=DAOM 197198]|nr:kinase-like domain-containing protein [Rhizophagus irregularis DAOM 181602=DAOM 197198]
MDTSKQNSDTTKTDAKNLWKKCDVGYQFHATIFSTDSTTESDETISYFKKVNIMDLEKEKKYTDNDFLNEIKYYISGHFHFLNTILCFGITQDPNTKDYMMVLQYCEGGILRNTLVEGLKLETKIEYLFHIIDGLSETISSS